ncbi:transglycosylase domain-containing protein [Streptomyces cinnamoneus]|uniref:Penicillin-binding protein n=1 Tax=Streptomyces cinnamoneus TaxID=53446 RepID=A0A918TYK8_STRCJ|nr:transglycosylase domain-containing protein [Streptomyces cinnamoneus]GHC66753.1 penicillin-binding protein [Streptomyces cinnamoneus]
MGRADARRAQKKGSRPAEGGGKPKKKGIRRFFTWKLLLAYFLGAIALGMGAFYALYLYVDVPGKGNEAAKAQSNVYKNQKGEIIARLGEVNREEVPLTKVPQDVQRAVVAAENKNFWTDPGVDLKGTARGILNTVMGRGKQGGSTITQQYVKNYYLDQRQTVSRKVKELIISLKVQDEKPKEEILAGYLNTSYFGRNASGIQAAARAYYGKDVEKITLEEGAYLAALLQAPSQYDWASASEAGKRNVEARWNYVLDKMVEQKWLDPAKRQSMKFQPPGQPKPPQGLTGQNGYLVQAARQEMIRDLKRQGRPEGDFAAGGWTITLSIDPKKQAALEKAVKKQLTDDLDPKAREVDGHVQPGAVSVDVKTGQVVAMYGGQDFIKHQTNNATRGDYQPASTFKPLILASALQNGSKTQDRKPITSSTLYDGTDKRPVVDKGSPVGFAPENEDGYSETPVTVQKAMNKSVNSVFAQMAVDVGLAKVKKTAVELGMKGDFEEVPSLSLGSMGASPLEMAGVYATLDNHGKKINPSIIKSVSWKGEAYKLPNPVTDERVVSRNTADGVTGVMTGVVDDGTAHVVASSQYQVAGKTGTSDDDKSAWFTGYTPGLVTSVGVFGEGPGGKQVTLQNTGGNGRVNGGSYPAHIWASYMSSVFDDDEDKSKFDLDTEDGFVPPEAPAGTPSAGPSGGASRGPSSSPSTRSQSPSTPSTPSTRQSTSGKPTPPTNKPTPPVPPTPPNPTNTGTTGDAGNRPNGGRLS